MQQGDATRSEEYTPIRLTIWTEALFASAVRALLQDLERLGLPFALKTNRFHSFRLFDMGHHDIYAVVRPFALLAGGAEINQKTIDVVAEVLSSRFSPSQSGITHTIFIFGPDGSVIRCLDVKHNTTRDVTKDWRNHRPQFSYTFADDEGYVSCLRCSATGYIGGVLRKKRQCPKCLGQTRHLKRLISRPSTSR